MDFACDSHRRLFTNTAVATWRLRPCLAVHSPVPFICIAAVDWRTFASAVLSYQDR